MKYAALILRLIQYLGIFIAELLVANVQVAKAVLSPKFNFKSGAIRYKSDMKNDVELILITNSITLTPGTLVMDADVKTGEVLVHVMSGESKEEMKKGLIRFPEKPALYALRGGKKS